MKYEVFGVRERSERIAKREPQADASVPTRKRSVGRGRRMKYEGRGFINHINLIPHTFYLLP